jgi:hypothetical protein
MKVQKPFALRSFRLPSPDLEIWKSAAARLDISQSEFLRQAIHEKAAADSAQCWRSLTVRSRFTPSPVDDLAGLVREGYSCPSKETIEEMLSFVVKPDGRPEAEEDCFDDRVIASAIAVQVHKTTGRQAHGMGATDDTA